MSSRTARSITYTEYDCYKEKGYVFGLRDHPPEPTTISDTSTSTSDGTISSSSPVVATTPTATGSPVNISETTPVAAIVGGVVASFALVVVLVLGILYFRRRKAHPLPEPPVAETVQYPIYKDPLYSPSVGSPGSPNHPPGPFNNYDVQ
jgi:hypothetical protein